MAITPGAIGHGGRLADARRLFPDAPEPFVDLSTGINPVPYTVPDLPAELWSRLPEPDAIFDLESIAGSAYGTVGARVVAAPGTQVLISMLPRLFRHASVRIVGPTYAEHAVAWASAGAQVRHAGSLDETAGSAAVVVCNPNNPDGARHDPQRLLTIARDLSKRGGLLVVDEAFADLEDAPLSLIPSLPDSGAVVLRSFGKTFGLAGARLGFAIGGGDTVAAICDGLGPWAVSGPTIEIAQRALADANWLAETRARLTGDVARLDALLEASGLAVAGGTRLFRLVEHGDAPAIFEMLGRAGIFVRRFPDHPHRLRFGLPGSPAAWRRLEAAFR